MPDPFVILVCPSESTAPSEAEDKILKSIERSEKRLIAGFFLVGKLLAAMALLLLACGEVNRIWQIEFGEDSRPQIQQPCSSGTTPAVEQF